MSFISNGSRRSLESGSSSQSAATTEGERSAKRSRRDVDDDATATSSKRPCVEGDTSPGSIMDEFRVMDSYHYQSKLMICCFRVASGQEFSDEVLVQKCPEICDSPDRERTLRLSVAEGLVVQRGPGVWRLTPAGKIVAERAVDRLRLMVSKRGIPNT